MNTRPPSAILPLLPYIPSHWTIWEPACGVGQLVRGFQDKGYAVVASDILDGKSFLDYTPEHFDCLVTNPPYSIKQLFMERAYSFGKPLALLMPLAALETPKRQALYKKYGLELIIPNRRFHFTVPVNALTPHGEHKSGSYFMTAWFTWGFNIGRQITFADVPKQ